MFDLVPPPQMPNAFRRARGGLKQKMPRTTHHICAGPSSSCPHPSASRLRDPRHRPGGDLGRESLRRGRDAVDARPSLRGSGSEGRRRRYRRCLGRCRHRGRFRRRARGRRPPTAATATATGGGGGGSGSGHDALAGPLDGLQPSHPGAVDGNSERGQLVRRRSIARPIGCSLFAWWWWWRYWHDDSFEGGGLGAARRSAGGLAVVAIYR